MIKATGAQTANIVVNLAEDAGFRVSSPYDLTGYQVRFAVWDDTLKECVVNKLLDTDPGDPEAFYFEMSVEESTALTGRTMSYAIQLTNPDGKRSLAQSGTIATEGFPIND